MASNTLFVSNFPFVTTEEELRATFEAVGAVESIRIILDRETGRSRGFAFVELKNQDALDAAIERLNDTEFHGRRLVVSKARGRAGGDSLPQASGNRAQRGNEAVSAPPFRHRIVVDWNDDDGSYVATVPDLGVSVHAETIEAAIRQAQSRARNSAYATQGG
jgi:RNA recognition motif-containing protein